MFRGLGVIQGLGFMVDLKILAGIYLGIHFGNRIFDQLRDGSSPS